MQTDEIMAEDNIESHEETLEETCDSEDNLPAAEEFDTEELSFLCPGINEENAEEYCNVERYRELKALGLSTEEAYAATAKKRATRDSRAHLSSSIGRGASAPRSAMTEADLRSARDIFNGMSDAEIRRLYKKVTA